MRLIDYGEIRAQFDAKYKKTRELILAGETHLDNLAEGFKEADEIIRNLPDIDAVPVVRCRACTHYDPYEGEGDKGRCCLHSICVVDDDFCACGEERKADEHGD